MLVNWKRRPFRLNIPALSRRIHGRTAGVAALVAALVLGVRHGFPTTAMPPHNMTIVVTGAGMLWVGWFGFNAGSALAANGNAGMAMMATHWTSPCTRSGATICSGCATVHA